MRSKERRRVQSRMGPRQIRRNPWEDPTATGGDGGKTQGETEEGR
jgi:hypothetical protein